MRIPKTNKNKPIAQVQDEEDSDSESTQSIELPEAKFSIRDKYKSTEDEPNENLDRESRMVELCASLMKSDKNVLSEASPFGTKTLEAITINFNANKGDKISPPLLKILKEITVYRDDLHK